MKNNQAKNNILAKLKNINHFDWESSKASSPNDFLFKKSSLDSIELFTKKIELLGGDVILVRDKSELKEMIASVITSENVQSLFCANKELLPFIDCDVNIIKEPSEEMTIASCESLVVSTGSIVVSSFSGGGRISYVLPEVLVIYASESQILSELDDVFSKMMQKYDKLPSWYSLITGPSRTADIEKTLVLGAHGPKKLIVIIDVT